MLAYHHGCPVPGVYVAKSWKVASNYPGVASTEPHQSCRFGVPGGALVAADGTYPLRVVIRCLADTTKTLWHRGSNQSLFRPEDLYISHVCIYAVDPTLVHKYHQTTSVWRYRLPKEMWEVSGLNTSPLYDPVSQTGTAAVTVTTRDEEPQRKIWMHSSFQAT